MEYTINEIAKIFKALGDPTRLKILKSILFCGNNICVGMITQQLEISQPAVSQHLKILKNADLVTSERMGFHIHYQVNKQVLEKYGIPLVEQLKNIKINGENVNECRHKGDNNKCNQIN